jgi:hypothetical protein
LDCFLKETKFAIQGTHSTYPKGGVSCSKDSLVVNGSLVFQIKFCGKSPALRVAANRSRAVGYYQPTAREQEIYRMVTMNLTLKPVGLNF